MLVVAFRMSAANISPKSAMSPRATLHQMNSRKFITAENRHSTRRCCKRKSGKKPGSVRYDLSPGVLLLTTRSWARSKLPSIDCSATVVPASIYCDYRPPYFEVMPVFQPMQGN